jgi:hypothetical protein
VALILLALSVAVIALAIALIREIRELIRDIPDIKGPFREEASAFNLLSHGSTLSVFRRVG